MMNVRQEKGIHLVRSLEGKSIYKHPQSSSPSNFSATSNSLTCMSIHSKPTQHQINIPTYNKYHNTHIKMLAQLTTLLTVLIAGTSAAPVLSLSPAHPSLVGRDTDGVCGINSPSLSCPAGYYCVCEYYDYTFEFGEPGNTVYMCDTDSTYDGCLDLKH